MSADGTSTPTTALAAAVPAPAGFTKIKVKTDNGCTQTGLTQQRAAAWKQQAQC
jgi:hypothetical protein